MDAIRNSGASAKQRDLDFEKDSLHILPLYTIPLQTPALKGSRMIKNVRFESMIEVFRDDETGSGQVEPSRLGRMFDWPRGEKHPDGVLIAKLSLLQSFDVYSLRIQLRNLGIEVENIAALRLSAAKRATLEKYMRVFTRPLMALIYAEDDDVGAGDIGQLIEMFREEDNARALNNLKRLSRKLQIILAQLPAFLTDYGDVFLSLAYFKDYYDEVSRKAERFRKKLAALRDEESLRSDEGLMATVDFVEEELDSVLASVGERIATFDKHSATLWENLTESSFQKVKVLIESNHSTIGGMLCGLHIKMSGFEDRFVKGTPVAPRQFADFVIADVKPGIDRIRNIERAAHYANAR